jgi:undecaprenyl-diphosphatase
MTFLQSIILGIVQGLTEFLPISSSAHLVLVPYWLNWQIPADESFIFNVLVQMGTLAAVIVYFWKDLVDVVVAAIRGLIQRKPLENPSSRLGWWVILATIPAGIFGLLVKNQVEAAFNSPMLTAIFLLVTAVLLILGDWLGKRQKDLKEMTWLDALVIGVFQALSIFPGISRSGSTISGGMFRKLTRPEAARFSFLMSIPIMIAAGGLAVFDMVAIPSFAEFLPVVIVGLIAAGIVGYLSIRWLLRYLVNHSFFGFAMYCIGVWLITFIVSMVRG